MLGLITTAKCCLGGFCGWVLLVYSHNLLLVGMETREWDITLHAVYRSWHTRIYVLATYSVLVFLLIDSCCLEIRLLFRWPSILAIATFNLIYLFPTGILDWWTTPWKCIEVHIRTVIYQLKLFQHAIFPSYQLLSVAIVSHLRSWKKYNNIMTL